MKWNSRQFTFIENTNSKIILLSITILPIFGLLRKAELYATVFSQDILQTYELSTSEN